MRLVRVTDVGILLLGFYFPMFGRLLPGLGSLRFNHVKYSMVILAAGCVIAVLRRRTITRIGGAPLGLVLFNSYVIAAIMAKAWWSGSFVSGLNFASGFILSTLVVVCLTQWAGFGRRRETFDSLVFAIGLMLIAQVALSAFETWRGTLLATYEIDIVATELSTRDVLSLVGYDQTSLFGFTFPFTGMIGQHNGFGVMLVFYNVLFITAHEFTRNRRYLYFVPIVMLGLIGNGTRSALVAVIVMNFAYALTLVRGMARRWTIILGVLALGVTAGKEFLADTAEFYRRADSLASRIDIWDQALSRYWPPKGVADAVVGIDFLEMRMGPSRSGTAISVENEFLRLYLYSGAVGALGFVTLLGGVGLGWASLSRFRPTFSMATLSLSVFFMGTFMTGITYYASYVLISLALVYRWHNALTEATVVLPHGRPAPVLAGAGPAA